MNLSKELTHVREQVSPDSLTNSCSGEGCRVYLTESCYEKAGDPSRAVNLYRAALSGPLREDTREEVKNMLNVCLAELSHQPAESVSVRGIRRYPLL